MLADEAPLPSVEEEPIAKIRAFSPFWRADAKLGSVAGAAMSCPGTSQGGLKGGAARAAALAPKKRAQIAAKAAKARWGKKP